MSTPEQLGIRGFGRLIGKRPSYVTQLREEGRLVMTKDGKHVKVAESIKRMEATADPSKSAVAARHAAERGTAATAAPTPPPAATGSDSSGAGENPTNDPRYTDERTRRERAMANLAELEYNTRIGKVLLGEDVLAVVASAMTGLRTRLTGLADVLGPQLAAITDESQVRIALADAIEHALAEAARQFQQLAQSEKGE